MEIIEPSKISGEIMDLIDTAKQEIIIVSPYNEITGWNKLIKKINKAQSSKVDISWYARSGVKEKYPNEIWDTFKIKPILLDNLHAKIYLNESIAVITSMNLSKTSDDNSTDIGLRTTDINEYNAVRRFYETYIRGSISINCIKDHATTKKEDGILEVKNGEISSLSYMNSIYRHLVKKHGKIGFEKKFKYRLNDDANLKCVSFMMYDYIVNLSPFDKAIKILIYLPEYYKRDVVSQNLKEASGLQLSMKELMFDENNRCVKYFYKSGFKLNEWDQIRVKFFLSALDTLIELSTKNTR